MREVQAMDTENSIRREFTISADAATVFAFFTDPQRLIRWIGISAELDPRPGGIFLVEVNSGSVARGEFKEVVPVSRLAYTWGWDNNNENVSPGSSLIEVDLLPSNGNTLVRFTHSGLPAEAVPPHGEGWTHYLRRLEIAASGRDPGLDPWLNRSRAAERQVTPSVAARDKA
jgi:uncharacterized protein YndB with AHSA1/START domain